MPPVKSKAVLVQCYNKPDTTALALNSLLKCHGKEEFNLVIWQDSEIGNPNSTAHAAGRAATSALIQAMLPIIEKGFKSVSYHLNEQNQGCYATCKIAIDRALEANEFVIFAEDDAIFSEDALDWFSASLSLPENDDPSCVAVTGESIFFDSQGKCVDRSLRLRIIQAASSSDIGLNYTTFNWVPSTVFAVDRRKWSIIGNTRGQLNGDVSLCESCDKHSWFCIFPMVARVVDIGMQHSFGFSVGIHTVQNVPNKTTYMTSDDLVVVRGSFSPYPGSKGSMYNLTVNLDESGPTYSQIYATKD